MGSLRRRWSRAFQIFVLLPCLAAPSLRADEASVGARQKVVKALGMDDIKALKAALKEVIQLGGSDNVSALVRMLGKIPETNEDLYWALVEGVASFTDRAALEQLGESVARLTSSALSRDVLYALTANKSKYVIEVLKPLVKKAPDDIKTLAVRKLGDIESKEAVDVLIGVLERVEKYAEIEGKDDLVWEALDSLENLTRQKFGANSVNWRGWWEKHRETARLGKVDEDEAGESRSTGTVVDSLDRRRKKEFFALEHAPKKGVVVLSAEFDKPARDLNNDKIQEVLGSMGVPHTVVKRQDFKDFDLSDTGALVINCAQFHEFCICPTCVPSGEKHNRLRRCSGCKKHIKFSAQLKADAIKKIKKFVKGGGYVFAEDWIVKEVLEAAYPSVVKTGLVLRTKKFTDVDVSPARGMVGHAYLKGIFGRTEFEDEWKKIDLDDVDDVVEGDEGDEDGDTGEKTEGRTVVKKPEGEEPDRDIEAELVTVRHRWTIDDESWAFDLQKKERVVVLLSSGELQRRTKSGSKSKEGQGVVAFAFRPGKSPATIGRRAVSRGRRQPGVVLQVLSHFGKQTSVSDEHLLQNLLLNFLIDANVEREQRAKRSGRE